MKKLFKIITVMVIGINLITTFAFAAATKVDARHGSVTTRDLSTPKDIICDDFSIGGDDVTQYGYKITTGGTSTVSIGTTKNESGNFQKALKISDKVAGESVGSAAIRKEFGRYSSGSGKIGFEMKFKMEVPAGAEKDYAAMDLVFFTAKGEEAAKFRVTRKPTDGIMRWDEKDSGTTNLGQTIKKDAWYTIKLILDFDAERVTGCFESDAFKIGSLYYPQLAFLDVVQETEDWVITGFSFSSGFYTADWYIDYIKVTKDPDSITREKFYRPDPIPMTVSKVFNNRAVPNKVNVKKDGVYKYFDILEANSEGNVFANVTSALNSFGLNIQISDGKYIAKTDGKEIVINADGSGMTINGAAISGSTYKNINGKLMVSLNEIAKAFGYKAEWNMIDNVLYITE